MSNTEAKIDRDAAVVGCATVFVANFIYLSGILPILDPMVSMEPFYIGMASQPLSHILSLDPGWGPLYALWLKIFVVVLGDPLEVYAANLHWLSFGVTLLIYVYVLVLTRRAALAVVAALFFLISDLNVPLFSKASGFAVLLTLAGLTLSELVGTAARRMSVVAATLFLAAYVRPELYVAALCLAGAAIWRARDEATADRTVWRWPVAVVVFALTAAAALGTPLSSSNHDGHRLVMALREHFAWNWTQWHDQARYFVAIWQEEFGDAQTVLGALFANPAAMLHHLFDNLLGMLRFLTFSAFNHYPLLAPTTNSLLVRTESLLIAAVAFTSLAVAVRRADLRRQMIERYGRVLFVYAIASAVCIASATLIYPEPHYLVIPAVLLMLTAVLTLSLVLPPIAESSRGRKLVAALVCLAVVPKPFVLPSDYVTPGSPFKGQITVTRTISDTIWFVRSLGLPPPVHVLTVRDGIGEMLGSGFHEIKAWQKGTQPLEEYVRDQGVNLIVNLEPGDTPFGVDDPYWKLLSNDPEAAGFIRLAVPDHEVVRVYVRSGQLP